MNHKRKQGGKAEDIEESLLEWFRNARFKKVPISLGILCEKAEQFAQTMFVENINPIDGWLTRWMEKNNIVYRKLHGKKQDTDFDAAVNWMTTILPQLLKDYDPLRSSTQMKRDCSIRLY